MPARRGDAARAITAEPPKQGPVRRALQRGGQVLAAPWPPAGRAEYCLWPSPGAGSPTAAPHDCLAAVRQLGLSFHNL